MKTKISTISILFIAFALIFNSCKKEDVEQAVANIVPEFSASIDGVAWKATIPTATLSSSGENHVLTILGTNSSQLSVIIYGKTAKIYKLDPLGGLGQAGCVYNKENTFTSISGEVNLTSIDEVNKKVRGTFSFVLRYLTTEVKITNGKFTDIKYIITTPTNK